MIPLPAARALLEEARWATLGTIAPDGRPRLVPVCFAVEEKSGGPLLWIPLDAKPKAVADPRALARVRDIVRDPRVTLLVDRWSEHWDDLAWVRLECLAELVEPPMPERIVTALLDRYPQYETHDLPTRPAIRLEPQRAVAWDAGAATRTTPRAS